MRGWLPTVLLVSVVSAGCAPLSSPETRDGWSTLEPGLELGAFRLERPDGGKPGLARILRIDPRRFELRLLNASAAEGQPRTARDWCRTPGCVAALNAGMYQQDYLTSVSLMRTRDHVNNPRLTKHRSVLAFDRLDATAPLVKLIDLECEDFDEWRHRYAAMVQSIRMISCNGDNVWEQQPERWSTAAVGVDVAGHVLFVHVRSLFSVHDLIDALGALSLELRGLMYAEGGPEAQMFVHADQRDYEFVGAYDAALGGESPAWPVPNVLAVLRRPEPVE